MTTREPDTTPTITCTRTHRIIDTCLSGGESPEAKLARCTAYLNIDKKRALDIGRRYEL